MMPIKQAKTKVKEFDGDSKVQKVEIISNVTNNYIYLNKASGEKDLSNTAATVTLFDGVNPPSVEVTKEKINN